jgi:hypothetical protein
VPHARAGPRAYTLRYAYTRSLREHGDGSAVCEASGATVGLRVRELLQLDLREIR